MIGQIERDREAEMKIDSAELMSLSVTWAKHVRVQLYHRWQPYVCVADQTRVIMTEMAFRIVAFRQSDYDNDPIACVRTKLYPQAEQLRIETNHAYLKT